MLTTIGPEIREIRERRKIAVETLALHAGVNADLLRRYELMRRIDATLFGQLPSESELERVTRALRTSINSLVKRARRRRPRCMVVTSGGAMTLEEYGHCAAATPPVERGILSSALCEDSTHLPIGLL